MLSPLPTGTVTFLFTDIEGSTRLAQQFPAAWPGAKARHHAILRGAIEAHGGYIFQVIGDAFCAAFHTASDALAAACDAQRALHAEPWGDAAPRVRIGLHTGTATARADGDYDGYLTLVRVQRIMSAAYGGQVLVSQSTAELAGDALPDGVGLRDLGLHRLKDLGLPEHLHQLVASDLSANFPALKTADHPGNLPTQLTSFVGREAEIAEARRLLGITRLLSLTGSGGVGKTRLALQVASEELVTFADGVWFVELAPLADPALIAATIASAVGAREEPNHPMLATLGDHFRAKAALIVLDNCEHLIAGAAQVCDALLRAAPHVKIVATSREALGIAGEHAYRVPSLGVPADTMPLDALAHVASVQLFNERARAAKSDFALTGANAPAVAQLCRRLDGIPLAIELAAARVKALSPEQIAARLDDRFRLLTGGSRTALPRQQTLRAAVDWSYSLLTEPERKLLRRLSVFAGGWTLEAAEEVASDKGQGASEFASDAAHLSLATSDLLLATSDVLDLLTRLLDKSLVVADEQNGEARYHLLETIRQYARDRLIESGEGRLLPDRHLQYCLRFALDAEPHLHAQDQAIWLARLASERDNLRMALDFASASGQISTSLRLVGALSEFWYLHPVFSEELKQLEQLLAKPSAAERTLERTRALNAAASLLVSFVGDIERGQPYAAEALAIAEELDDPLNIALALRSLGIGAASSHDLSGAAALLQRSVAFSRQTHQNVVVAETLGNLGCVCHTMGDYDQARMLLAECLALFREAGHQNMIAWTLRESSYVAMCQGDLPLAARLATESIHLNVVLDSKPGIVLCLAALAGQIAMRGSLTVAVRLCGAVSAHLSSMQTHLFFLDRYEYEKNVGALRTQLNKAAYDAAWNEGRALSMDQAIALALDET